MISATWNAPSEAFDNPNGELYGGKGTADLFLHITSNYKFMGFDILAGLWGVRYLQEPRHPARA